MITPAEHTSRRRPRRCRPVEPMHSRQGLDAMMVGVTGNIVAYLPLWWHFPSGGIRSTSLCQPTPQSPFKVTVAHSAATRVLSWSSLANKFTCQLTHTRGFSRTTAPIS